MGKTQKGEDMREKILMFLHPTAAGGTASTEPMPVGQGTIVSGPPPETHVDSAPAANEPPAAPAASEAPAAPAA